MVQYKQIITCIFIILNSCNVIQNKQETPVAYIDSYPISNNEIDSLCQQELFDELNRIYLIRKITLEQVIKKKLLQIEAKNLKTTVENLIISIYDRKITPSSLERFAVLTQNTGKIVELRENLVVYDIKSSRGKELLISKYKEYLLNQFVDSLKGVHKIVITLKPSKSPKIILSDLIVHEKGNTKGKVSFMLVTDFDCHMCREQNHFYEELYNKYQDKILFGFTHYGSYVSNSAIASECAANQGKFWEMHDSIFNAKHVPDSVALFRMARNLNLDMNTFGNDYKDKALSEKIMNNLLKLESAGIYGTPTIMINNQLVFNSTSLDEIEKMLKEEIEKVD